MSTEIAAWPRNQPGKELDRKIAIDVMGWTWEETAQVKCGDVVYHWRYNNSSYSEVLPYSTDISAAWEMVGELVKNDMFELSIGRDGKWYCGMNAIQLQYGSGGESAAHAICLAALKAVEKE